MGAAGQRGGGRSSQLLFCFALDDLWSKKTCRPKMIVDHRCYIHLRQSCLYFPLKCFIYQTKILDNSGYFWPFLAISGYFWLFLAIFDYFWRFLTTFDWLTDWPTAWPHDKLIKIGFRLIWFNIQWTKMNFELEWTWMTTLTTLTTWMNKLNRPQIDPCQPPMNWDELEGWEEAKGGMVITNFDPLF